MKNRIKETFRALGNRNYRLFFFGNGVSLIGTWMQSIAVSWLVYRLTGSPLLLGIAGFSNQIPSFFLAPFGGVIADRFNRHRLLLITQSLAMIQAFLLSFFVILGHVNVTLVIALSAFLGLVNAFDVPVRQSFVNQMVEKKEDLGNAIALNSSIVNVARLIGPSIAGIIIAAFGEAACFIINGLSYLAVLYSLLLMNIKPIHHHPERKHILREMFEGVVYAYEIIPIRYLLLLLATFSLVGLQYSVVMPIFAQEIFHGGPQALGWLLAAAGCGALLGALYLASRRSVLGLSTAIARASAMFAAALILFSLSRNFAFSLLMLVPCGTGMIIIMAATNTILQTIVEENKRGRIMSLFTMAFIGMSPFGALLIGWLSDRFQAPAALVLSGIVCLAASLSFNLNLENFKSSLRKAYEKIGILSEISAIQSTNMLTTPPEKEF